MGYRQIQEYRQIQASLTSLQNYQRQGRYVECQQIIQSLSNPPEVLRYLGFQCAFQGVQQLVNSTEWEKAIAMANAMPDESEPLRSEAHILIRGEQFLALEDAQQEGDLNQARAIADEIDSNHPLQAEIQLARFRWQAEEQLWVQCLDLLDLGKWMEASERVQPLMNSPYFQGRALALLEESERNQLQ